MIDFTSLHRIPEPPQSGPAPPADGAQRPSGRVRFSRPVSPLSIRRRRQWHAEDRLAQEGFRLARVDVPNNDYPPGYVVGQDPCAGCFGRAASPVTAQVSNGQRLVPVPSVLGLSEAGARQTLESVGLRIRAVQEQEPPAADAADRVSLVWKQNPSAGASAVLGSSVMVWVNPPTPPPTQPPPGPTPTTAVSPPPPAPRP